MTNLREGLEYPCQNQAAVNNSEFLTAACISYFVAKLEELMGQMNPFSYGRAETYLWMVRRTCPKTWKNCMEMCKRESRKH